MDDQINQIPFRDRQLNAPADADAEVSFPPHR